MVGLVLDAHIRRLTAGRRSFDDELWIYFTMRRRNLTGLQKVFWCGLVDLLLARLPPREDRRLRAHGRLDDDGGSDPWTREAPLLAGLAAASVQGVNALAPPRGASPGPTGQPPRPPLRAAGSSATTHPPESPRAAFRRAASARSPREA